MSQIIVWQFFFMGIFLVCLNSLFAALSIQKYLKPLKHLETIMRALEVLKYDALSSKAAQWKAHAASRETEYYAREAARQNSMELEKMAESMPGVSPKEKIKIIAKVKKARAKK